MVVFRDVHVLELFVRGRGHFEDVLRVRGEEATEACRVVTIPDLLAVFHRDQQALSLGLPVCFAWTTERLGLRSHPSRKATSRWMVGPAWDEL